MPKEEIGPISYSTHVVWFVCFHRFLLACRENAETLITG
jgi:hypothetical protein